MNASVSCPKQGCLCIVIKKAAGLESAFKFYEEMVHKAGGNKIRGITIDATEGDGGADGFVSYGLICGIEEFRDKKLKIALVAKTETALENYFRETMAVNRGISLQRFNSVEMASAWIG